MVLNLKMTLSTDLFEGKGDSGRGILVVSGNNLRGIDISHFIEVVIPDMCSLSHRQQVKRDNADFFWCSVMKY